MEAAQTLLLFFVIYLIIRDILVKQDSCHASIFILTGGGV